MRFRLFRKEIKFHVFVWAIIFALMWPLAYMVSCSFKDLGQIFSSGLNLIPNPGTAENYERVFSTIPFWRYVKNSVTIAGGVAVAKAITSILAGYVFSFIDFKHRDKLFYLFTVTMFIPFTVIMIPNYLTLAKMNLINNPIGVMLPQLGDAMGIFLMRQSMRTIPKSLVEVARLDKVGHVRTLTRIVVPLCKSSIFAMFIMFFINSWNEYFWPMLILTRRDNYTLTLAMQMFLSSEGGSAWGSTMALAALATFVPLLAYLISQRFIIRSYITSGIKE
jgi:sn-glycerol 3-phosphate transport system permease protein